MEDFSLEESDEFQEEINPLPLELREIVPLKLEFPQGTSNKVVSREIQQIAHNLSHSVALLKRGEPKNRHQITYICKGCEAQCVFSISYIRSTKNENIWLLNLKHTRCQHGYQQDTDDDNAIWHTCENSPIVRPEKIDNQLSINEVVDDLINSNRIQANTTKQEVSNLLRGYTGYENCTDEQVTLVRTLAMKILRPGSDGLVTRLENIFNQYNYKVDKIKGSEGSETINSNCVALVATAPWCDSMLKQYKSPMIVDGTFAKEESMNVISLSVVNGRGETVTVKKVIKISEDKEGYQLLFDGLDTVPQDAEFVVVADGTAAVDEPLHAAFPNATRQTCAWHFEQIWRKKFGPNFHVQELYAAFGHPEAFDHFLRALLDEGEKNHELGGKYIEAAFFLLQHREAIINPTHVMSRGEITSNRAESQNSAMKRRGRDLVSIISTSCMDETRHYESVQKELLNDKRPDTALTNYAQGMLDQMVLNFSYHQMSCGGEIDESGVCSCHFHELTGIPCSQILLRHQGTDARKLVSSIWNLGTLRSAYQVGIAEGPQASPDPEETQLHAALMAWQLGKENVYFYQELVRLVETELQKRDRFSRSAMSLARKGKAACERMLRRAEEASRLCHATVNVLRQPTIDGTFAVGQDKSKGGRPSSSKRKMTAQEKAAEIKRHLAKAKELQRMEVKK